MNSGATVVISGIIAQYLPIENDMIRMQMGLFINELLSRGFNQPSILRKVFSRFWKSPTHVTIKDVVGNESNPIYCNF